jgi:hypothetical protein
MPLGWFRAVHCKSQASQETRALLTARKLVQSKLYDVEMLSVVRWFEILLEHFFEIAGQNLHINRIAGAPCADFGCGYVCLKIRFRFGSVR